jgi:hypothetical protein
VELRFDLIDVIAWTGQQVDPHTISPEGRAILEMCQNPVTVADLASAIGLPLGVVRVLLGDLVHDGLVDVRVSAPKGRVTDQRLLARVLAGVRALLGAAGTTKPHSVEGGHNGTQPGSCHNGAPWLIV